MVQHCGTLDLAALGNLFVIGRSIVEFLLTIQHLVLM